MSQDILLHLIIFFPLVGSLAIAFLPKGSQELSKRLALVAALVPFVLCLVLYAQYLSVGTFDENGFIFYSAIPWFVSEGFKIQYIMGLDGISVLLLLLNTLLFPICIYFSWGSETRHPRAYYALMLLLEVGVSGFFVALDMVMFYVFFEMVLIPMYFLIGIWGGADRVYASLKFFLYTLVGSLLMLIAIIYIGTKVPGYTFITEFLALKEAVLNPTEQMWLFAGFAFSFAIKVPIFPLHTWLPDAHTQAPTAGSVILAGVLLKMGSYGLIRFCLELFPEASLAYAPWMCGLAVIGIIYGAMAAMAQSDIKKLVAFSSVSHMGFIVLGTFAFTTEALTGAVIQMINHGISTGALFLMVGMIYDRRHTRQIKDFQGIAQVMPKFAVLFMISVMASVGLPGLNGFVGEFTVLLGAWKSDVISVWFTILAATGVIIAAVYLLWMFRRVLFGSLDKEENRNLTDLDTREVVVMIPLVILMFLLGLYPFPFLEQIDKSTERVVNDVLKTANMAPAPEAVVPDVESPDLAVYPAEQ